MKKLLISAALLIITLTSCSSDEKEPTTGGLTNARQATNRYKIALDLTDDGIENFGIDGEEYKMVYVFEYKGSEKKVTISALSNSVVQLLETYTVTSQKDGNISATNGTKSCVFRFKATEVHQILKTTGGEIRYRYYFQ